MGIGSMVRLAARVAVFAAMAALLLQASCTIGLNSLANTETISTAGGGCHDSAPVTPSAPGSGHICCNGEHAPEALLSAVVMPAPLASVGLVRNPFSDSSVRSPHAAEIAPPVSGPPGPLALRI
jgi:hypothetical protein